MLKSMLNLIFWGVFSVYVDKAEFLNEFAKLIYSPSLKTA